MTNFKMPETNLEWLEERTILLAPTGSYAYGTNTQDSDRDYKGICIPPIEYYLGLKSFNEYSDSGGKNFKNTKDDVDVTILHINKFVKDAMAGVPNSIELLFIESDQYLKISELGQMLIDNRHLFLSKQINAKFGGYAYSQMQKLKAKKSNGTGRQDLIQKYDYDTKFFMHSIRLLTNAIEILETGGFHTRHRDSKLLLDCRNGKYSFEEALELCSYYDGLLKQANLGSNLPERPDYNRINELLIDINKKALEI